MPRPSLISRIHELKYELRRTGLNPIEIPKLVAQLDSAILQACKEYHCSREELLRTVASDFGKWVREENLPWQEQI